jgi:hypothetical protein
MHIDADLEGNLPDFYLFYVVALSMKLLTYIARRSVRM